MANADRPAGFKPHKGIQRNDWYLLMPIELDYGTDIFIGDAVQLAAAGINQAAATTVICGVALEFFDNNYAPILYYKAADYTAGAGTQCYVMVCMDPMQLYVVQDDAAATGDLSTIGQNCDIVVGTGNSTSGVSAMELGFGSLADTAGLQCRVLGYERRDDNAPGNNCDWIVQINQTQFANAGVTGIAGI